MLDRGSQSQALTDLILEVFRVNGCLIAAGDELVSPIGLTSARWQVLGAIALAPGAMTVPQLAGSMGLTRQSVQRIVNDLIDQDIVRLIDNPRHKRSRRVTFTGQGETLYAAASKRQAPWAQALAEHFDRSDIERSTGLLRALRLRLEARA